MAERVLRWTPFDVEDVELKGTPMVVSWGGRRGEVSNVTYGFLAKMPRDWKRSAEWESTTCMTVHELRALPEHLAVPEPPVAEVEEGTCKPVVVKGSVPGKKVDPDDIRGLEGLAKICLGWGAWMKGSRAVVVPEDVQAALAILHACTRDMNADGSLPLLRVKAIWDRAFQAGDTARAFSFHRFQAIRDMLSDLGLLEWEDRTYRFGHACKWRASEKLMGQIEKALKCTATTPSLSSIVLCNMVAEAKRERPRNGRAKTENDLPLRPEAGLGRGIEESGAGTALPSAMTSSLGRDTMGRSEEITETHERGGE